MTFQNGTSSGHDLTHHFHDDRTSISYSSANGGLQQNHPLQLFANSPPPATQPTTSILHQKAGEPAVSQAHLPLPTLSEMTNRPKSEQAIMPALQDMAAKADCADFIQTMEQYWPGPRTITFPVITIPNINTSTNSSLSLFFM